MKYVRFAWRFTASCFHVLLAKLLSPLLGKPAEKGFSPFQRSLIRWLIRTQLRLMGVRIQVIGQPHPEAPLIVANHISWLDILVIGSLRVSRFLSKSEVRKWFLIGGLATHFGTLFLNRGGGVNEAYSTVTACLCHNTSTVIFPEGTTSDGRAVRKFYPRLFGAAIESKTQVQPLGLYYPTADGVNPIVPFVRDQSLLKHASTLLFSKHIDVQVRFFQPVASENMRRDMLAERCHELIASGLQSMQQDHTRGK